MASITTDKNGRRTVQFVGADRKRRSVRLGKVPMRTAESVKLRIEHLAAAMIAGHSIDGETARWLAGIDVALVSKLAAVGLCEARELATLAAFIKRYIAGRTDVKPATKEIWSQGERGMVEFFGASRSLRGIKAGHADAYKLHLIGLKLATMTVRKRLQFAKMICRAAVRLKLIDADPFAGVGIKTTMPGRQRFVSRAETAKLLNACTDHHWQTIIALARYGGLRCPSEVLSLTWQDIDWDGARIRVPSPKTEHHPGRESRMIPLFPELLQILEEAFEMAPVGAVYVVDERFRKAAFAAKGWRNCNLRTTFLKIIRRAGLEAWKRPFHNLRSTRQTELAEKWPSHVVCAWLGNSEEIARTHYLQVTDAHFEQAAKGQPGALQNPVQQAPEPTRIDSQADQQHPRFSEESEVLLIGASCEADGEGFEPTLGSLLKQFSRLPP